MLNCFALDRDADCNEDDKGEGEDGEEDGKDDVGLLLNLLCSRHLANRGVAQHQDELETVEKKMTLQDLNFLMVDTYLMRKVARKHPQIQMSRRVG